MGQPLRWYALHILAIALRVGHAQPVAQHNAVQVNASADLASALSSPYTTHINLIGSIKLNRMDWREGGVVLAPQRRVVVRPAGPEAVILDMGNIVDAIHLSENAVLELQNITLMNLASFFGTMITNHTRYVVPFLPMWPSITFEPGAVVVEDSTLQYSWSSMPGVGCESFKEDVTRTLRPYGLEESLAFPPRNLSLCRLRGTHVYQQPILDILTNATAGSLSLNETDITTLCVPYPVGGWGYGAYNDTSPDVIPLRAAAIAYPSGSSLSQARSGAGSSLVLDPRFIALIIAVVLAALLSIVLAGFLINQRLRSRLRQVQDQRCADIKDTPGDDGPMVPRSPFEDMKVALIDGARAKSDRGMFPSPRSHEALSKELTTTWESVEDSWMTAKNHQCMGSADSAASSTIQLSSVPSHRVSLEDDVPLRRSASLTTAGLMLVGGGGQSCSLQSARSVDSGSDCALLSLLSLPSLPSLPPTPGRRPRPAAAAAGTPAPILAAPSVQQAATLSHGELVRLARQANLTSKASLASLPSLASASSREPSMPAPSASMKRQSSLASRLSFSSAHSSDAGSVARQENLKSRQSLPGTEEEERSDKQQVPAQSPADANDAIKRDDDTAFAGGRTAIQATKDKEARSTPSTAALAAEVLIQRHTVREGSKGSKQLPLPSPFATSSLARKRGRLADFAGLQIGKLIGTGSFGRVYKGSWRASTVAIKVITHNATLSRKVDTLRESLVGISIQHPNVMTTYKVLTTIKANALVDDAPQKRAEAARANGYSCAQLGPGSAQTAAEEELLETWLLLEYCDGGPLDRAIANKRFKNLGDIYLCLMDIAAGMIYLHSLGIVHSDLKGANVLLKSVPVTAESSRGFVCKLADFGLSRVLGANRNHVSTNSHGTVSHQPMEVLHDGRITRSSDVYSFAMIMLEMITGVPVFEGFSSSQILYQVFNGARPHMPEGLPAGYKQLIEDCWHSDHTARPTFVAIHERLRSLYQELQPPRQPAAAAAAAAASGRS